MIGTTPSGNTVTETSTQVTTPLAGPQGMPVEAGPTLGAETNTTVQGQTIDGIQCNRLDQLAYQVSAHLQVYVAGRPRALPGTIGLVHAAATTTGTTTTYAQGLCTYWVRTTAANGVIQVRSPVPGTYTLGELFDIWGEPLSSTQVATAHGPVSVLINNQVWRGDPRTIPLREHEAIQLAVGRPVPGFHKIDWSATDL